MLTFCNSYYKIVIYFAILINRAMNRRFFMCYVIKYCLRSFWTSLLSTLQTFFSLMLDAAQIQVNHSITISFQKFTKLRLILISLPKTCSEVKWFVSYPQQWSNFFHFFKNLIINLIFLLEITFTSPLYINFFIVKIIIAINHKIRLKQKKNYVMWHYEYLKNR